MPRNLIQVQEDLAESEACLSAILKNQEYRIGSRWYTRADLATVYKIVKDLRQELAAIERGGSIQVFRPVPRDF